MAAREWSLFKDGDGDWLVVDDTDYDITVVCAVHKTNENSLVTMEDNARLIVSAPRLLAELEAITDHLERTGYSLNDVPFIRSARAAIAKAKGA